jgi:hypothetical protein
LRQAFTAAGLPSKATCRPTPATAVSAPRSVTCTVTRAFGHWDLVLTAIPNIEFGKVASPTAGQRLVPPRGRTVGIEVILKVA